MKTQHMVAVTLIGWYLLVPPPNNRHASLSRWKPYGTYDSARECEDVKNQFLAHAKSAATAIESRPGGVGHAYWANHVYADFKDAQCVATDDARLAR